ncbi:MAG TPA: nicotinate (nicotinamide) nucleotide adenylyltransferase [Chitinophagales bacterium]|jgi:nicotinate-nucleotide adenylyltransferase|nr:nicotinate (nicotinamide) nucleotide adenylyltransferase [Chitinophagales bacterium]
MRIGLFFGSFNPVHTGHLIIASYFAENTDLQQVWFIVSPQNPFKDKSSLLDEKHRLYMVNLAVENNYKLQASNIEFHLPQPSYTIHTLTYLGEKYPEHTFVLLMGSDNLPSLHKWKQAEVIMERYPIYVYMRRGIEQLPAEVKGDVRLFELPLLDISSTLIRQYIREGKSIRYLVPENVFDYLQEMRFYR